MNNLSELRSLIRNLDSNNKSYIELVKKSEVGKYIVLKQASYTLVLALVCFALLINFFYMPIQDVGQIFYLFITFDFITIKQNYGFIQSLFSSSLLFLAYHTIVSTFHFSREKGMDIQHLSLENKRDCIVAYYHYKEEKEKIDRGFSEILKNIKSFNKNNDINEVKKLLFKNEIEILDKLLISKSGKDLQN